MYVQVPTDLIFVIDSSSSINAQMYDDMKLFLINLISDLNFNTTRIGLMQFASRIQLEWDVNEFETKAQILEAILNLEKIGGGTWTQ